MCALKESEPRRLQQHPCMLIKCYCLPGHRNSHSLISTFPLKTNTLTKACYCCSTDIL